MKALAVGRAGLCLVSLCLAWPALAQDKPAPAPPPATATAPPSDQEVLEQCKQAALAKDLPKEERRKEIAACAVAATPKILARIRCAMDPRLKTLDKTARDVAILECIEGKPVSELH